MTRTVSLLDYDRPAGYVDLPCPEAPTDEARRRKDVPVRRASAGSYAAAQRLAAGVGTIEDRDAIMRQVLPTASEAELSVLTDAQMEIVCKIATQGIEAVLQEMAEGNPAAPGQAAPSSEPATGSATS